MSEQGELEQHLYAAIDLVIVDRNKVLNVGLSDDVTDAVMEVLRGWRGCVTWNPLDPP